MTPRKKQLLPALSGSCWRRRRRSPRVPCKNEFHRVSGLATPMVHSPLTPEIGLRELQDHTGIYGREEEKTEGNKTCYSLKPKSLVEHTSVRWYLYIFLFPSSPFSFPSSLSLSPSFYRFFSVFLLSLDMAGRIVALGYQTGHKLIPSNVLIRYPILGSPPGPFSRAPLSKVNLNL